MSNAPAALKPDNLLGRLCPVAGGAQTLQETGRPAREGRRGSRLAVTRAMRHLEKTPPFLGPDGRPLPGSIAEAGDYPLGGVPQWVMIRGQSLDNPPLILLHGGPGFSETTFHRVYNADLERRFTVVYWDQRGAGNSYDPHLPKESMTVEQFLTDLDQLVDAVRLRLGKEQVVICGHSWGTVLGVLYTARYPQKVAAYVGAAQIGDWRAAEAASYRYALAAAERAHHRGALKKLRAMGPPPYSARSVMAERTWIQRLDGQLKLRELWKLFKLVLRQPEGSLFDLPRDLRGFRFSMDALWPEVSKINLLEAAPALQVPVYFFLGRKDHWVPPETSLAYYEALQAPSKRLLWFEDSGHELFADEPARFNAAMLDLVRPALA